MNWKTTISMASAAVILPAATHAAIIEDSAPYGPSTVPFSGSVWLDQYSGNPSDLLSVTLEISATLQADITFDNNAPSAVSATVYLIGSSGAAGPSGLSPVVNFFDIVAGPVALGPDGSPTEFTNFGGTLSDTKSNSVSTSNSGDFGPFLGAGQFEVDFNGTGGWSILGVSNGISEIDNFDGSGTIKVIYNVVPEPHEYALFAGLGLVAFAGWRRFRA